MLSVLSATFGRRAADYFGGIGEHLEFIHRAHSRETLAHGALRAAQWLAKKQPGLYGMLDVLGLESRVSAICRCSDGIIFE